MSLAVEGEGEGGICFLGVNRVLPVLPDGQPLLPLGVGVNKEVDASSLLSGVKRADGHFGGGVCGIFGAGQEDSGERGGDNWLV